MPHQTMLAPSAQSLDQLSMQSTLADLLFAALRRQLGCVTISRNTPGSDAGVCFLIFNGISMGHFGPHLLALAHGALDPTAKLSGRLAADQSATMHDIFNWLDGTPPRCAHGWITMSLDGGGMKAYAFGFTGPICAEVLALLKRLGCDIRETSR